LSLFTDSNVTDASLMQRLDPEVESVLAAERKNNAAPAITIDGPGGIAENAWSECRSKLEAALASFNTYIGASGTQPHIAAVLNTGSLYGQGNRPRLRLQQIIASDFYYANSLSPIQRWVTYSALKMLFQTAANRFLGNANKSGDRYEKKYEFYGMKEAELWRHLLSQGIPWVYSGLDCPGAAHGWNAGVWDESAFTFSTDTANTNATDQTVRIAITYFDGTNYISPTLKNNSESGPSRILETTIPAAQLLTVSIARLNPPEQERTAACRPEPRVLHVSAGNRLACLRRRNRLRFTDVSADPERHSHRDQDAYVARNAFD
jgi:hypothetical protein